MNAELDGWSLVVASNDEAVLGRTLLASPCVDSRCQVIVKRGFTSATKAYNAGLAEARNEVVVFAHQDVYLPETWLRDLRGALQQLAQQDPNWGVLGVFGIANGDSKEFIGHCYSTGLKRVLGKSFAAPVPATSLDELLLVVRRSSCLSFDQALPGFHLYATDICLQAERRGMRNYVIPAFCIHNSNGLKYYPQSYWQAYMYVRKKWWKQLPVKTCCVTVTKWCKPMLAQMAFDIKKRLFVRPSVGTRQDDMKVLYESLQLAEDPLCSAQYVPTLSPDNVHQLAGPRQ